MTLQIQITERDVAAVLNSKTLANPQSDDETTGARARRLFLTLDHAALERAAVNAGHGEGAQTSALHEAIERQLIAHGVLTAGGEIEVTADQVANVLNSNLMAQPLPEGVTLEQRAAVLLADLDFEAIDAAAALADAGDKEDFVNDEIARQLVHMGVLALDGGQQAEPRKLFRTIVRVEVLSQDTPIEGESLEAIAEAVDTGDCVGSTTLAKVEQLTAEQAAQALVAQGSDPDFFGLEDPDEAAPAVSEQPSGTGAAQAQPALGTGLYRSTVEVEVLSQDAPVPDGLDLKALAYNITDGDWSGTFQVTQVQELTREAMAQALIDFHSSPDFFGLDDTQQDECDEGAGADRPRQG